MPRVICPSCDASISKKNLTCYHKTHKLKDKQPGPRYVREATAKRKSFKWNGRHTHLEDADPAPSSTKTRKHIVKTRVLYMEKPLERIRQPAVG